MLVLSWPAVDHIYWIALQTCSHAVQTCSHTVHNSAAEPTCSLLLRPKWTISLPYCGGLTSMVMCCIALLMPELHSAGAWITSFLWPEAVWVNCQTYALCRVKPTSIKQTGETLVHSLQLYFGDLPPAVLITVSVWDTAGFPSSQCVSPSVTILLKQACKRSACSGLQNLLCFFQTCLLLLQRAALSHLLSVLTKKAARCSTWVNCLPFLCMLLPVQTSLYGQTIS